MKKIRATVAALIITLTMCGCVAANARDKRSDRALDDYQYMTEVLGFTEEELEGFDIIGMFQVLNIRERNMSSEDVHKIVDRLRHSYTDNGTNAIYMITTASGGAGLTEDIEVSKASYYVNNGVEIINAVYDIDNKQYYLGDITPHDMTDEQAENLRTIATRNDIKSWETRNVGEQEKTTGVYEWKIVLQDPEGNYYVYEGNSPDGSAFPPTYKEVSAELASILR